MKHARKLLYALICIIIIGFVNRYWNASTAIWIGFGLLGCYLIGRSYEEVN